MSGLSIDGIAVTVSEINAADELAWLEERLAHPAAGLESRVVLYREPCVILGRSQLRLWDHGELQRRCGLDVIARSSGGGVVLAGPWMVGVSVVAPGGHPLARCSLMESYRWFGGVHERALRRFCPDARARPPESIERGAKDDPVAWMCFASLSGWELSHGSLKLCGHAQVRRRNAIALVGGTLIVRPPWERLAEAFGNPEVGRLMDQRATSCAQLGSAAGAGDVASELAQELLRAPANQVAAA